MHTITRFSSRLSAASITLVLLAGLAPCRAQELQPIVLPKPQTEGGKPLMQALKERKSARAFSGEKLPLQVLSNLLWAAWGVSRPDGRRTAPSAANWQEIDVYVAMAEGLYLYEAVPHRLKPILAADIRAKTGPQPFVGQAPVNLVYVADDTKIGNRPQEEKRFNSAVDTGFIGQNVYLFCTSEGLATVFRGMVDRESLAKIMNLRPDQRVVFAQSVGYPGK
jgi:SagB-type dehydrogenase family enzyme